MDNYSTLVFVTGNELKFKVAQQTLQGSGISLIQKALDTPEIQSTRVEEIAEWSAVWASQLLGQPVIVTDAGYYIDALNGFPGPFIKFVNEWFTVQDYLNLMQDKHDRCVIVQDCLAYCRPNEKPVVFSQEHYGKIATQPGRPNGTPINQIFIPDGCLYPISDFSLDEQLDYWSKPENNWQELKLYIQGLFSSS
jgi:XTP/dITP diphosphohydrolase